MVANIISRASKGEQTIFAQEIDKAEADTVALYIGSKSTIESIDKSLNIYTNDDIIKKLLNDEKINCNDLAKVWYEAKGIRATEYTPVFLIKNKLTIPFENCCPSFRRSYESRKKYFEKEMKFNSDSALNSSEIKKYVDKTLKSKSSPFSKYMTIWDTYVKSAYYKKITLAEFEKSIKEFLSTYPECISSSSFKKAVCYLWYLKFEQK